MYAPTAVPKLLCDTFEKLGWYSQAERDIRMVLILIKPDELHVELSL